MQESNDINELTTIEGPGAFPALAIEEAQLRNFDPQRGRRVLTDLGCKKSDPLYKEYNTLVSLKIEKGKDIPAKKKAGFTAKFILQAFQVLKLKETSVFYIGHVSSPLFVKYQSLEELEQFVGQWYQVFFGFAADIQDATKALLGGILPGDSYTSVDRTYILVTETSGQNGRITGWYWNRETGDLTPQAKLPENTRVFARMFDTDRDDDENIFKVPPFDEIDFATFFTTYNKLKDIPYKKWPAEYHFQCFKDWSDDRPDVEFGMFTVLAVPFMRPGIMRGSIFNEGDGHNGKSVLNGLATSLIGSRNTTTVSGNDLGKWDYLVDLQTTWFNCPSETELDFLKENTGAFKTISAHETLAIRKKHGDASIPVAGAFPIVFNINKMPALGDDALAILSRMFINSFDVDFEATGREIKDYARKVFLTDKQMMPTITGAVLAFAHYYSQPEHLWAPSPSMTEERDRLKESATPQFRYVKWYKLFFCGFTGVKLLKSDFANFGRIEGEDYDTSDMKTKSRLLKAFKRQSDGKGTRYILSDSDNYPVNRFLLDKNIYIRKYMGTMNWPEFQDSGGSLIYMMMLDYLGKEDEYRKYLNLNGKVKTEDEIRKKVLQDMWHEIDEEQKGGSYER